MLKAAFDMNNSQGNEKKKRGGGGAQADGSQYKAKECVTCAECTGQVLFLAKTRTANYDFIANFINGVQKINKYVNEPRGHSTPRMVSTPIKSMTQRPLPRLMRCSATSGFPD